MTLRDGFGHFRDGLAEWRRRPGLMLLGVLPAILVLTVLAAAFVVLLLFIGDVVAWATPFADGWNDSARRGFRFLLGLVVVLAAAYLAVVTFTGITLAVGDPIYAKVWRETEAGLGGTVPVDGVSWWRSVRDSAMLIALGLLTVVGVFVVGLLPVVGTLAGPVIGFLISGRVLARGLLSRPLAARGLDRRAPAKLLRRHERAVIGFGALAVNTLVPAEPWLWVIYAVAAFNGFLGSFSAVALQAAAPGFVPRDKLPAAGALLALNGELGSVLAPALGGVIIATPGMGGNYVITALLSLFTTILVWRLPRL
jgi:CysZ protein